MRLGVVKKTGVNKEYWENSIKGHNFTASLTDKKEFTKTKKTKKGKTKKTTYVEFEAMSFTHPKLPYTNQVHHILPKGALYINIGKLNNKHSVMRELITVDLLLAKYNINFKDNMIILPSTDHASKVTSLPKHLGRHESYL